MKNRIFAAFLSLCMVLGTVPAYGQSAEESTELSYESYEGEAGASEDLQDPAQEPSEDDSIEDGGAEEPLENDSRSSGEQLSEAGGEKLPDASGEWKEEPLGAPGGSDSAPAGEGEDPVDSGLTDDSGEEKKDPLLQLSPTPTPELTVTPVPEEEKEPEIVKDAGYLSHLAVYSNGSGAGTEKLLERQEDWDEAFGGTVYSVTYSSVDTSMSFFVSAQLSELAPENSHIVMSAYTAEGEQVEAEIPGDSYSQSMRYRLYGTVFSDGEEGGQRGVYTLKAGNEETQERYIIVVCRTLELANIACFSAEDKDLVTPLFHQNYDRTVKEYQVLASADTEAVKLRIRPYSGAWFDLCVNGEPFSSYDLLEVPVAEGNTEIRLDMEQTGTYHDPEYAGLSYTSAGQYVISVNKREQASADFALYPEGAVVSLYDSKGDRVYSSLEEPYHFSDILEGETYTYNVSAYGYVSVQGSFIAKTQNSMEITLEKSETEQEELTDNDWAGYQNSRENNGITKIKTPSDKDETMEKWSVQLGGEWSSTATPPLILDGVIYTAAGKFLYKLDRETGEILAVSDEMAGSMTYALNPLAYGNGMIFAQIGNGQIQAFQAKTLKSLWISEAIGGQTLSPITYKDGFVYTGTWNSETTAGDYFCLSVTDEDPQRGDEIKYCTWRYSHKGGFYWAGAYAADQYVIFGSDDGSREGESTDTSILYSVSTDTGLPIDKIENLKGDIRTSVVYENGCVYFATKGGMFYRIRISEDGHFEQVTSFDLGGMATASPVVYKGRIYIGVCGPGGRFSADGGHHFDVLSETAEGITRAYSVSVPGYPQAAAVLSNAYEQEDFDGDGAADGRVYLYFTYNAFPGGICMLADEPGKTAGTAELFYKPDTPQQQYCISPICVDRDGTLYYKNDSSYLIAVSGGGAYLDSLDASTEKGTVSWKKPFQRGHRSCELTVGAGVERVHLSMKTAEGRAVTVDGQPCEGDWDVQLGEDGAASVKISVTAGRETRTYEVKITRAGEDASLAELAASTGNKASDPEEDVALEPAFSPAVTKYSTVEYTGEKEFLNLYVKTSDPEAHLQAAAGKSVKKLSIAENPAGARGYTRISVYFGEEEAVASVKLTVTSADQEHTAEYTVSLKRTDVYAPHLTKCRLVRTGRESAELLFSSNEKGLFAYTTGAPGEAPLPDLSAGALELKKGENAVQLSLGEASQKEVSLLAQDHKGNRMEAPVTLTLPAYEQLPVTIRTKPEKAKLTVTDENGREVEKTDGVYVLFAGNRYKVTAKCKGYETVKETILAEPGKTEYEISLKNTRSADADLKALYVSSSEKYRSGILKLSPKFEKEQTAYYALYEGQRKCLYVWPQIADENASMKIYAVSGLDAAHVKKDETIKAKKDETGRKYWPVYFGDQQLEAKIRICVTAEDGTRKNTFVTLALTDQTAPVLKKISAGRISSDTASVVFKSSEKGVCSYVVTEAQVQLQNLGLAAQKTEIQEGTTTLSLTGLSQGEKEIHLTVTDDSGNESEILTIPIPDIRRSLSTGQGLSGTSGGKISSGQGSPALKGKDGQGSAAALKTADGNVSHGILKQASGKKADPQKASGKKSGNTAASQKGNEKKESGKKGSSLGQTEESENRADQNGTENGIENKIQNKTQNKTQKELQSGTSKTQQPEGISFSAAQAADKLWNQWGWRSRIILLFAVPGFLFLLFWLRAKRDYQKVCEKSGGKGEK